MSKQPEHILDEQVALAIQAIGSHVRSWKRVNGLFVRPRSQERIMVGIPGACDRHGFIGRPPRLPIPFEVELKIGRSPLSAKQLLWKDHCSAMGIPWFLCRARDVSDISDAAAALAREIAYMETFYADLR